MSEVKTDKLTGVSTADVINVTVGSTTSVLQLGIATHTLHYNHQSDSVVQSTNTSSVSDDAAGEYTANITSAYADINSIHTISCSFEANGASDQRHIGVFHRDNSTGNEVAPTTTAYKVSTDTNDENKDLKYNYTTRFGDLA